MRIVKKPVVFMLFRLCTRCSTYFCIQCCSLNEQIVKLLNEHTDNFWFCPDCACQSYYATIKLNLPNLENSKKLVLDKLKNVFQTLPLMTHK